MESKIWDKSTCLWNRIIGTEDTPVVAKGEGAGEGMEGDTGLANANFYI